MTVTLRNPLVDNAAEGYEEDANPNTTGFAGAGFFPQNASSNDMAAGISRDVAGNLTLTDAVSGTKTLTQLAVSSSGLTQPQVLARVSLRV